jgi:hypothetical protein
MQPGEDSFLDFCTPEFNHVIEFVVALYIAARSRGNKIEVCAFDVAS